MSLRTQFWQERKLAGDRGDEEGNLEIGQAMISCVLRTRTQAGIEGRVWDSGVIQMHPVERVA